MKLLSLHINHLHLLIFFMSFSIINDISAQEEQEDISQSGVERFTFLSGDNTYEGKIHLPPSYSSNADLPVIILIDYTEQHFKLAKDEFEKVIEGVEKVEGVDALVVSLNDIPDIDAEPDAFAVHYQVYLDMAAYVEDNYSSSSNRTLIAKGSEAGIVLMALFTEGLDNSVFDKFIGTDPSPKYSRALIDLIASGQVPDKGKNTLHFSFSTSNDRTLCNHLIKTIEYSKFPWLTFKAIEYTDSDYENTYPVSYAEGLKFVFER